MTLHCISVFLTSVALLHILFSSSTGHTEYVVDTLIAALRASAPKLKIEKQRVEVAQAEDLLRGDVLLLASGTWNTGGSEGQLHPRMYALLNDRAKEGDLQKKPCVVIALGDDRYFYTARAMEYLLQFVMQHDGKVVDSLAIVNEPYGQEEKVNKWAAKLLAKVPALSQ